MAFCALRCILPHCWLLLCGLPRFLVVSSRCVGACCLAVVCVAVCCAVSLGAVLCRVAAGLLRPAFCCCALRRVISLCLVLSRSVLCPWPLSVSLGSCAFQHCVLSCLPALCALCCVCFGVVCWCVLLFATVLFVVCVLGCRAVRSLSSPPCVMLRCAVLVRLRGPVCLVCVVSGAWCCRVLLSVVRLPAVLCCVVAHYAASSCGLLWCAAASSAGGWLPCCAVQVPLRPCSLLVPCSPVLCPMVYCCRVVPWCPVLLHCLFSCLCWLAPTYFKNHRQICYNVFSAFESKIKLYTTQHARRQAARPYLHQSLYM